MATLAQFRLQFGEFAAVSDPVVTAFLGAAQLELDTKVWGAFGQVGGLITKADQAQLYLAAHKMAISPFGQAAKTLYNNKRGYERTTYGAEFLLMQKGVVSGFRVA